MKSEAKSVHKKNKEYNALKEKSNLLNRRARGSAQKLKSETNKLKRASMRQGLYKANYSSLIPSMTKQKKKSSPSIKKTKLSTIMEE